MSDWRRYPIRLYLAIAGLLLLCINPEWTQGERDLNLLLVAAMILCPLTLLLKGTRVIIPRIDIPLGMVCLCVILFPLIFHPQSIRWTTMLFTCAYCVYFMMLARLVRVCGLTDTMLLQIIRVIMYVFLAVLIIQQICVIFELPVFLGFYSYYLYPWKLNSLTAEPSHTTVTLATLMFFYTRSLRRMNNEESLWLSVKREWKIWGAYIWILFSTQNSSAFLLGPMCLLPYITRKNVVQAISITTIACIAVFLTPVGNLPQLNRLRDTVEATATLNEQKIMDADISASARLVPTIRGIKAIKVGDISELLTGYGVDADKRDTAPRPCDLDGAGFAGIFSMLHNYGAICALAFWAAIGMVTIIRNDWLSIPTFLLAWQLSADYNMQLVWMVMAFAMVFKYEVCKDHKLLRARYS